MKSPHILIVDDQMDMRMVLKITLERVGWRISEAADGSEVMAAIEQKQPDIVLLDYNMPEVNGLEACKLVKGDPQTQHIPVVIYTGAYADGLREASLAAGAEAFITKPILPKDLREKLSAIYETYYGALSA